MKIYKHPSPNFNDRRDGQHIDMLVIHYTGMKSAEDALERLSDPEYEVSSHYLIDENGKIYQLVEEEKRAWHAGISSWQGEKDINSRSIGIELYNKGSEPFSKKQMEALEKLCRDILDRHNIPENRIVGHSCIAPNRKQDPGHYFDWKMLSKKGIGHWPEPKLRDKFNSRAVAKCEKKLTRLFRQAGYHIGCSDKGPTLKEVITAFQRRFQPELFHKNAVNDIGKPNKQMVRKLRAMRRQKNKKK